MGPDTSVSSIHVKAALQSWKNSVGKHNFRERDLLLLRGIWFQPELDKWHFCKEIFKMAFICQNCFQNHQCCENNFHISYFPSHKLSPLNWMCIFKEWLWPVGYFARLLFLIIECVFQEWVWPVGYFLQAKLHFAKLLPLIIECVCFRSGYGRWVISCRPSCTLLSSCLWIIECVCFRSGCGQWVISCKPSCTLLSCWTSSSRGRWRRPSASWEVRSLTTSRRCSAQTGDPSPNSPTKMEQ